jgi:hypothetical protein
MNSVMDDEDDEIFIGTPTEAERVKLRERRRTILELPSPLVKRVERMCVKSFVLVCDNGFDDVPATPAKVFELISNEKEFSRFQIRYKNAVTRELQQMADDERSRNRRWRSPAIPSFVFIPSRVEQIEAVVTKLTVPDNDMHMTEQERSIDNDSIEPHAAYLIPTPIKLSAIAIQSANYRHSTSCGIARERAVRFAALLAEREGIKNGSGVEKCAESSWRKALPFLTEEQKDSVNKQMTG